MEAVTRRTAERAERHAPPPGPPGPPRPPARRRPPRGAWRRPRLRSGLLLAALTVITVTARLFAHFQTEWLWFREVGQERVFWTMVTGRWLGGGLVALVTAAVLLANFWLVDRAAPEPPGGRPVSRRARRARHGLYAAVSAGAGVLAGALLGARQWEHLMLWRYRSDFGVSDPVFHRDLGFFVFSLPVHRAISAWLFAVIAFALAAALTGYAANGGVALTPRPLATTRGARAHLLVLGALLLVVKAWRYQLGEFALLLPRPGVTVPGGYTDLHVQLPWLRVMVAISLVAALVLLLSALHGRSKLPAAVAAAVVALAELSGPAVVPGVVQRYFVDPQTLSRERPYIARQIRFTQLAYGLHDISTRGLPANAQITEDELRDHGDVLRNIQLWDAGVLQADINEHQSIGSFYSFPNVTVDRYRDHGRSRTMLLAERELDLRRLELEGRTWANDRLAYTHGSGLVAVPGGEVDREGRPRFSNSDFGAGTAATRVREPRVYFGVQPRGAQRWVITNTNRSEVEKPLSGASPEPVDHYRGAGGFAVEGPLRRAVLAVRFGEPNLLLSQTIGDRSRIVLHRDAGDRVRTVAPFLTWDDRPAVAVVGGRVMFLLSGYTSSGSLPYAAPVRLGRSDVNYLREAAVATVDAYSGEVTIYATGTDPILRAWRAAYPTLFTPAERMPAALRAHLRYPEKLFEAQSRVWATYHAVDVDSFYTRVDDWQQPADLSGPLDRIGSIRFQPRTDVPLDDAEPQDDSVAAPRMRPAFVLARLPGERHERFMLTTPFTAQGQENMTAYLAGFVDRDGRPRLAQLTLPRSHLVLGPAQVARRILATPAIGDRLRLLNAETTDLGDRAVESVDLGAPRVIPIADSFLYVMPVYVTAAGHGVTRLRLVTVFLNGHVGYGRDLDEAIARAQAARDDDAAAQAGRGAPGAATAAPSAGR